MEDGDSRRSSAPQEQGGELFWTSSEGRRSGSFGQLEPSATTPAQTANGRTLREEVYRNEESILEEPLVLVPESDSDPVRIEDTMRPDHHAIEPGPPVTERQRRRTASRTALLWEYLPQSARNVVRQVAGLPSRTFSALRNGIRKIRRGRTQ